MDRCRPPACAPLSTWPNGQCWSVGELTAMTAGVGFVEVEHRVTAGDRRVLVARNPG